MLALAPTEGDDDAQQPPRRGPSLEFRRGLATQATARALVLGFAGALGLFFFALRHLI